MERVCTRPVGRTSRAWKALLTVATATVGASLALAVGPGIAPAAAACPHALAHPHQVPLPKIRKAITCLVNKERSKRNRPTLKPNRRLQLAAQRHNDTMLAQDCFQHRCEGESGISGRVKKTGYTRGERAYRFAEDLGYENTPRQMLGRWLHSPTNRRRMLKADFRDVGVGVGWGAPVASRDDSRFETYTLVLGWRRP
jgi:uncharacterized protein YkwD